MASLPGPGPSRKTGAIRKQLIRNIEKPIQKQQQLVEVNLPMPAKSYKPCSAEIGQSKTKGKIDSTKFRVPELHSTLNVVKKLDTLNATIQSKPLNSLGDLTPKSKAYVKEKITCKLNFPKDRPIYNNLTSINVNDSVLELDVRKSKNHQTFRSRNKDPVPVLTDYLDSIKPWNFETADNQLAPAKQLKTNPVKMWDEVWDFHNDINS